MQLQKRIALMEHAQEHIEWAMGVDWDNPVWTNKPVTDGSNVIQLTDYLRKTLAEEKHQ